MMKLKHTLLVLILFLLRFSAFSQDVAVIANYPEVVRAGEQFAISWVINSGGGEFEAPSFDGFYKLMGPQTSYSSSTQMINGKVTRETSYTYTYYVQALKAGKFVIPPALFTLKNKTYKSDSLTIEVIGSNAAGTDPSAPDGTEGGSGIENTGNSKDEIFLNLTFNRKEVYIGEGIVATVKLFTRVDLSGINEIKYPSFEGFLKNDLNTPPLTSLRRENVNGTVYGTGVIQQFLLYPQVTGDITIDPVSITVLVQQKSGQSDPFFGDFFSTYTTVPKAVLSGISKIKVKPLPGNKPDDFSGIVGKVSLQAELDHDSVLVNDAVNLKITVTGSGNLKLANAPKLKLSPDIEVYEPKVSDELKNGVSGTSGRKVFEYLLIPRHNGDFTIPPVTYSYFDISTNQYRTLKLDELRFHARKGTDQGGSGITVFGGVSREEVKYIGKDIRFIKSQPGTLKKSGNLFFSKRLYYSSYILALLTFFIVLFIRREQMRRNANITLVKNRKAGKIAVKRLKNASECLKTGQMDKFYEEILKAVWGYLSDKLSIPVSDLTRATAVNSLMSRGIGEEMVSSLTTLLDVCEYARFAPSSSGTEAEKVFEDAAQFIKSVENSNV